MEKGDSKKHTLFNGLSSLTSGQKAADALTKWAGSWTFILFFLALVVLWMIVNSYILLQMNRAVFDPYPFILLNLGLSLLAAIQAPIILMSQNRSSERDRLRVDYDYSVNRKAEKEIRDIQKDLEMIKTALKIKKK